MEREHMEHLLKTRPGIGVEATTAAGDTIYYFYEDFDYILGGGTPGSGIDRAMKQLYPAMDKGMFAKLVFIEHTEKAV
jgi:hypothetical protein